MVFSFFKKDPKDARPPAKGAGARSATTSAGRTAVKSTGRPAPEAPARGSSPGSSKFATTETALPGRDLARSLAMETAAKIDKIESEMARDFMRPAANTGGQTAASVVRTVAPISAPAARSAANPGAPAPGAVAPADPDDGLDAADDSYFGSSEAIELHTSGAGSIIDETAILFANAQEDAAEATLRAGIDGDDMGAALQNGWLMLFELVNQRGDKAGFEQLTMQYALRFENSPPAWIDYAPAGEAAGAAAAAAAPVALVKLPATIDAAIVKLLEQLKTLAAQYPALTLDVSAARSVDLVGAELLLRVINAFKRSSHELTLVGPEHLVGPLRAAVEPGRRDASDAGWMLLLEVLRVLNRQEDFEETGIQFCITFEVSPPSWEPAPVNLKARSASPSAATPVAVPAEALAPLDWRGAIRNEGEPWFGRMLSEARSSKQLVIECRLLQRVDFSAASALLSHVMKLQASGVSTEFRSVNPLIAALFHLLGISAVSMVRLRRS